ncbi:MAG: hypothetical protein GXY64_11070 [Bacteroidales bacterium]|nr:hypothetical protein [Bacteroidales bacterium]
MACATYINTSGDHSAERSPDSFSPPPFCPDNDTDQRSRIGHSAGFSTALTEKKRARQAGVMA